MFARGGLEVLELKSTGSLQGRVRSVSCPECRRSGGETGKDDKGEALSDLYRLAYYVCVGVFDLSYRLLRRNPSSCVGGEKR